MNSKQLGLTEYNDIILSLYDANPIANISESVTKTEKTPEDLKPDKKNIGTGLLYKETIRLRNVSVLNVKLAEKIFKYEKERLTALKSSLKTGKSRSVVPGSSKKKNKEKKKEKDEDRSIRDFLKAPFRKLLSSIRKKISDFFKKRLINRYKKLPKARRDAIRRANKAINRFKKKGGVRGFLRRRSASIFRRIVGPRNAARLRLFKMRGGFRGAATRAGRRAFFGAGRKVRSGLSSLNQLRKFAQFSIQDAKGPTKTPSVKKPGIGSRISDAASKLKNSKPAQGIAKNLGKLKNSKLAQGLGKNLGKMKGIKLGGVASALFAGFEFAGRKSEGQSNLQAGVGTAASTAGGIAGAAGGAKAGALAGAAIGSIIPGAGTAAGAAIGGVLGGLVGGFGGSFIGGKLSDAATGVDAPKQAKDLNLNQFGEGGEVSKPQLVLVGEGGETEWVVPKSKLAFWLGSKDASEYINFGLGDLVSGASKYLKSLGESGSDIPELSAAKSVGDSSDVKVSNVSKPKIDVNGNNLVEKIIEFIKQGFNTILDPIKNIIEKVTGLIKKFKNLRDLPGNVARSIGGFFSNIFTPNASAAELGNANLAAVSAPENISFGRVTGNSGSVAYGGKENASLSVAYSPFKASDIKSKNISIVSGKGYRKSTGTNHKGYDLPAPAGTPLYAYLPGKVTRNSVISGYGNALEWVDERYNEKHFFAHMQSLSPVKTGQKFKQGALLGYVGDTGTPGSFHLHWEIGGKGSEVDPGQWVNTHPLKPINKDTKVGEDPLDTAENDMRVSSIFAKPITQPSPPQYIPIPIPSSNKAFALNTVTPSWGHGALVGGN